MFTKSPPGKSLAEVIPQLAAEWHPNLNGDLTPHDVFPGATQGCGGNARSADTSGKPRSISERSGVRLSQVCGRSHSEGPGNTETRAIARGAQASTGCGWHPTLNGDLTPADVVPGSTARVWWRCSACQFEWPSPVYRRGRQGAGCRECSNVRGAFCAQPRSQGRASPISTRMSPPNGIRR